MTALGPRTDFTGAALVLALGCVLVLCRGPDLRAEAPRSRSGGLDLFPRDVQGNGSAPDARTPEEERRHVLKTDGLRIYLVIYALSLVLSCVLGPRRGHSLLLSAFGGFALGPLNLLLLFTLAPHRAPGPLGPAQRTAPPDRG